MAQKNTQTQERTQETGHSSELDRLIAKPAADLDRYADDAKALQTDDAVGLFTRALKTAGIMKGIRDVLKQPGVLDEVASLAGSAVGFRTDRDRKPQPYSAQEIGDAVIEAVMIGVPLVGNCFNIISHRCYITVEGFGFLLRTLDGMLWQIVPGIPHMKERGAVVEMTVTANYKGREIVQALEFPIRVNEGMGADAIIGKATRKARKWLYDTATGSDTPDGDILTDEVLGKLARASKGGTPTETAEAKGRLFAAADKPADASTPEIDTLTITPIETAQDADPVEDSINAVVASVAVPAGILADWTKALPARHPFHTGGSLKQLTKPAMVEMIEKAEIVRAEVNAWVDAQAE
jgi:hypothetical protein